MVRLLHTGITHILKHESGITFRSHEYTHTHAQVEGGKENTHTTTPVKFTIASFSSTRQLKYPRRTLVLQKKMDNKMMEEKCLPSFHIRNALELHMDVRVHTFNKQS